MAPNKKQGLLLLSSIIKFIFRANVRSAVRVFTGEAGVTFALL
jgi:hypothetical protein